MRYSFWRTAYLGFTSFALVVLPVSTAHAEDDDKIWNAVAELGDLYDAFEYEKAFAYIQKSRSIARGVDGEVTLSLYEGIVLYEMGRPVPAQAAFRSALLMRPGAELPENVAPKLSKFFEDTRLAVARELSQPVPAHAARSSKAKTNSSPVAVSGEPTTATSGEAVAPPAEGVSASRKNVILVRIVHLSARLTGMETLAKSNALRQLHAIGTQIQEATTMEDFEDAVAAVDSWEARYLSPESSNPTP
ncbi:MAG: hypothetical protein ABW123_10600 [Cystobacter sp.]